MQATTSNLLYVGFPVSKQHNAAREELLHSCLYVTDLLDGPDDFDFLVLEVVIRVVVEVCSHASKVQFRAVHPCLEAALPRRFARRFYLFGICDLADRYHSTRFQCQCHGKQSAHSACHNVCANMCGAYMAGTRLWWAWTLRCSVEVRPRILTYTYSLVFCQWVYALKTKVKTHTYFISTRLYDFTRLAVHFKAQ